MTCQELFGSGNSTQIMICTTSVYERSYLDKSVCKSFETFCTGRIPELINVFKARIRPIVKTGL